MHVAAGCGLSNRVAGYTIRAIENKRLGVAEQIKGKLIPVKGAGEAVANGETEIGFTQVSEILPYAGAEVGGMLPPEIQSFTSFSIGIHNKDSAPAEALVKFLTTPAAAEVIKTKGLEPR
jgi:molybdate transport system substrate-binding protein